jgi:hypothetical protein
MRSRKCVLIAISTAFGLCSVLMNEGRTQNRGPATAKRSAGHREPSSPKPINSGPAMTRSPSAGGRPDAKKVENGRPARDQAAGGIDRPKFGGGPGAAGKAPGGFQRPTAGGGSAASAKGGGARLDPGRISNAPNRSSNLPKASGGPATAGNTRGGFQRPSAGGGAAALPKGGGDHIGPGHISGAPNRPANLPNPASGSSSTQLNDFLGMGGKGEQGSMGNRPGGGGRPTTLPAPDTGSRPGIGNRPGSGAGPTTRPAPDTGGRPGTGNRPGSGGRPTTLPAPDTGGRPGIGDRPGSGEAPTTLPAPDTGSRPGMGNRPGSGGRPTTLPAPDTGGRPGIGDRPGSGNGLNPNDRRPDINVGNVNVGNSVEYNKNQKAWINNQHNTGNQVRVNAGNRYASAYTSGSYRHGIVGGYPYTARWVNRGPYYGWTATSYASFGAFMGPTWANARPVYYAYGDGGNVYYENNTVYMNNQPAGTPAQYTQQLQSEVAAAPATATDSEWLPLGVFAFTREGVDDSQAMVELAVNKHGVIAGTYYNEDTGVSRSLKGTLDRATQRVAVGFADGKNTNLTFETGIYDLTQDEAPGLLHFGTGESQPVLLVRLQPPKQ